MLLMNNCTGAIPTSSGEFIDHAGHAGRGGGGGEREREREREMEEGMER
jgi:hypothetical protein